MPGTVVSGWRVISEWADQTKILTSHSSIPAPRNGAEIQGLDVGLRQFITPPPCCPFRSHLFQDTLAHHLVLEPRLLWHILEHEALDPV